MRQVFPLLLLLVSWLAVACGSSEANQAPANNEAAGPVVTVYFSPS